MKLTLKLLVLPILLFSQATSAGAPDVEFHAVSPDLQLPFSEAVRVGHMLYLSGQSSSSGASRIELTFAPGTDPDRPKPGKRRSGVPTEPLPPNRRCSHVAVNDSN